MLLRMAIIFERKTVYYENKEHSVFKAVDIDVGGFGKNDNGEWLFAALSQYFTLYVINEVNIKNRAAAFTKQRYFAGMIDETDFFDKYHVNEDYDYHLAIKDKLSEWEGFYFLSNSGSLNRIYDEKFLEKIYGVFHDNKKDFKNSNTSNSKNILKKYGVFLTDKEYSFNPAIGRDREIENVELALLGLDKSAIIVGESGVGKTAIVEGLAYKIKNKLVPDKLKDYEIISINTSSLVSGCRYVGMIEERVNSVINELIKNKKTILFIDEIHTLIGAGVGSKSNLDIANILKPFLDRGNIKIIGCTTFDEYNNLILDSAFKRRFKKISLYEPDKNVLFDILDGNIVFLEKSYGIKFIFDDKEKSIIINCLIDVTSRQYRDSIDVCNNPDLVLNILKEAFCIASLHNRKELLLEDIVNAIKNEDRLFKSSRERFASILVKDITYNVDSVKKLTKIIRIPFNND